LAHREGAESTPRARISMRPKLARSCWSNTMTGKSLRKTGTEGERQRSGIGKSAFGLSSAGAYPSRSVGKAPRLTLDKLLMV
jgi:hypothetical protein